MIDTIAVSAVTSMVVTALALKVRQLQQRVAIQRALEQLNSRLMRQAVEGALQGKDLSEEQYVH